MSVVISMLRGVNLGGHNVIRMEELRTVYASLKLRDAQTCLQSGNVVFRYNQANLPALARRIETAIERTFGFRTVVILRTPSDLRSVIAANPFAGRRDVEPNRLLVTFLAAAPSPEAVRKIALMRTDPEELRLIGRELFVYYPNGMGRSKLSPAQLERVLETSGTGRNWNTVRKLLEIAGKLEAAA